MTRTERKLLAIYSRVSSEEQAREGYSIPEQIRAGRLYAELHGLVGDIEEYTDPGISGRHIDRPEFARMMRDVKAGRVDVLIVRRLDRLHRNLRDFLETLAFLEEHDVALHSITEHVDTKSATGRLLVNILMAFHAFQSEKLREDVMAGMHEKLRGGGWANQAPIGYRMEEGELLVDEETAEVVRESFRMAMEGASLRDIAEPTGRQISSVAYMLTNPVYAGYVFEHRDKLPRHPRTHQRLRESEGVYPATHEALVGKEEWDMVQHTRARVSPGTTPQRHLLAGLLRCGNCGAAAEQGHYSPTKRVYRCSRKPRCYSVSTRRVEITLLHYLDQLQREPALAEEIRQALEKEHTIAERSVHERLVQARHEYEKAAREENRWRTLFVEAKIDEDEWLRGSPSLGATRQHWEDRVAVLEDLPLKAEQNLVAFEEHAALLHGALKISSLWDDMTEPERGVVIREFVEWMKMGQKELTVKCYGFPEVALPYVELRGRPRNPANGRVTEDIVCSLSKPAIRVVRTTPYLRVA